MSNKALNTTYSNLVEYTGKSLFDHLISTGADLNEILCVLDKIIHTLYDKVDLTCVDLTALGITLQACDTPGKAAATLCDIINSLAGAIELNQQTIDALQVQIDTIIDQSSGLLISGEVKISATDSLGYLGTKLTSDQTGTIVNTGSTLKLRGFVPIGFIGFYSGANKFDITGKGLPNTDAWGWAICNGQNGTDDIRDMFILPTGNIGSVGQVTGSNTTTLTSANIPALTSPVTGVINNALSTHSHVTNSDTILVTPVEDGTTSVVVANTNTGSFAKNTSSVDQTHAHTFNLQGSYTNGSVTPISTIPKNIKLIPIKLIF